MSTYNQLMGSATAVTNGRGVVHSSLERRLDLAAACVLGQKPLQTSFEQAVPAFRVPRAALRERIELYRALDGNWNEPAPVAVAPAVEAAVTANDTTAEAANSVTAATLDELSVEVNALLSKVFDIEHLIHKLHEQCDLVTDRLLEVSGRLWDVENSDGTDDKITA
jgi:hypothetical protein